jgi:hypothetical protein
MCQADKLMLCWQTACEMILDHLLLIAGLSFFAVSVALILAGAILAAIRLMRWRPPRPGMLRVADQAEAAAGAGTAAKRQMHQRPIPPATRNYVRQL